MTDTCEEDLFTMGGYVPAQAGWALGAILTFAGPSGRQYRVEARDAVIAFLALERDGLIPDAGQKWKQGFADALMLHSAAQGSGLARYSGLEAVPGGICDCCEAECHAVFVESDNRILIERWSITTTVMVLIRQGMLPELPFDWHMSLERHYERICETGRRHYRARAGGPQHV
jgi:hypothetical protein